MDVCPDIGLSLRLAHDGKFLYLEIEQRRDLACANIVGHEASGPRDNLELVVARQRALPYRWYHARPNAPFFAASYGEVNFRNHVLSKETCGDAAFYAKSESVIREPDRWIQRFSFPLEHLTDAPLRPGDAFYLTPVLCANSRLLKRTGGQYCVFTPVSFATVHTVDRAARVVLDAAGSPSSGAFSFARDGRALAEIVVAPQATRSARFGALELQAHLKAITGADFAIVTPTNRTPGLKPVYVGESEPERRLAPSVETFARQELLVSVRHDAVVLVGADDPDFCTNGVPKMSCLTLSSFGTLSGIPARWSIHGTLDAVYEFLENDCGVCWFDDSDDGTDYMENPSLAVPVRTRRVQPFVFCRSLSMDSVLWRRHMDGSVRERLVAYRNAHKPNRWTEAIVNAQRDVFRLRRRVCGEKATCNHSFYDWYDRFLNTNSSAFVAWHPEYFAQDARRQEKRSVFIETAYDPSKRPPQLCYTNPDVIRQVVEDVRSYFDRGGSPVRDKTGKVVRYDPRWGRDSCALEPMDNDGFCQCARCRAEYPDFVTNTSHWAGTTRNDHWFGFVNKVAREIRKSHPTKRVSTLAYMSHTAAPSFRMEDNVIVHFCHHGNRMPQGVSLIARLDRQMKEWKEVLKPGNLGLWFYNCFPHDGVGGMSKDFMCFPGNFLDMHYRQYQDLVKTCQARECVFYCGCTGDLEDYAISRWFWNPDETPETIKARWFSAYGAAGPAVREFYEIIEERFTTPAYYPPKAGHQNEPIAWRYLGTEEVEAKLSACVARAKEATGLTDRQRARLARWLLGTWQYVKDGPRQPLPCASGRAGVLANLTTYKYRAPEPIARDVLKGEKAVCCALDDDRVAGKPQGTTDRLTNGTLTNNYYAVISGKVATNALLAVLKPVDGLRRLRVTVDRGDAQRGRSAFAPVGLVDGKWIDLAGEQITDLWVNGHLTRNVYEFLFLPEAVPAHLDGIGVRDFSTALKRCTTRFALIEAECAPRPGEKVWSIRPEQVKVDFLEHADGRVYVKVGVEGADVLEPVAGIHFVKGPALWTPAAPIWYPLRVRARTAAGDECVTALEFGIRAEKTKGGRRLQVVRPEGAQAISKANVTEKGVTVK